MGVLAGGRVAAWGLSGSSEMEGGLGWCCEPGQVSVPALSQAVVSMAGQQSENSGEQVPRTVNMAPEARSWNSHSAAGRGCSDSAFRYCCCALHTVPGQESW